MLSHATQKFMSVLMQDFIITEQVEERSTTHCNHHYPTAISWSVSTMANYLTSPEINTSTARWHSQMDEEQSFFGTGTPT